MSYYAPACPTHLPIYEEDESELRDMSKGELIRMVACLRAVMDGQEELIHNAACNWDRQRDALAALVGNTGGDPGLAMPRAENPYNQHITGEFERTSLKHAHALYTTKLRINKETLKLECLLRSDPRAIDYEEMILDRVAAQLPGVYTNDV